MTPASDGLGHKAKHRRLAEATLLYKMHYFCNTNDTNRCIQKMFPKQSVKHPADLAVMTRKGVEKLPYLPPIFVKLNHIEPKLFAIRTTIYFERVYQTSSKFEIVNAV